MVAQIIWDFCYGQSQDLTCKSQTLNHKASVANIWIQG